MIISMEGFNTQLDPMAAIGMLLEEYEEGFISGIEFISGVKAINTEWSL